MENKRIININAWERNIDGIYYSSDPKIFESPHQCLEILLDNKMIYETDTDRKEILFNDSNHPYSFLTKLRLGSISLFINPEAYSQNPQVFESIIIQAISNFKSPTLSIDENLKLTPTILEAIINNSHINSIHLNNRLLNINLYQQLRRKKDIVIYGNNVSKELLNIYDGSINLNMTKPLVYTYTYKILQKISDLIINEPLTPNEIYNLKEYAPNLESLTFQKDGLLSFRTIIEHFKDSPIKIIFKLEKDKIYNLNELKEIVKEYPNIIVEYEYQEYPLQDYIKMEEHILKLIEPINNLNLTPLEKFIYVFNVTKRFREYKENDIDPMRARNLISLFENNNDTIVCVGYSVLLEELCLHLNIPNVKISADIGFINESNEVNYGGHARNLVYLKDDKYHIDGFYISDATWSNNYEYDSLVTALLTPNETTNLYRIIKNGEISIISSQSYQEFLSLIYQDFKTNSCYLFNRLIISITKLYPSFISILSSNKAYQEFNSKSLPKTNDYYNLFIDEEFMKILYNFIKTKMNNIISGETLINASVNLQRKLHPEMTEEELLNYRNKLIADNQFVYEDQAPPIVAEHYDNKEIIANETNKFGQGPRKI